jgi:hypothetical protein
MILSTHVSTYTPLTPQARRNQEREDRRRAEAAAKDAFLAMLEEAAEGGDLRSDTTYTAAAALLNADGRWKEVKEDSARRELLFDFQKALRRKVGGGRVGWGGGLGPGTLVR